MLEFVVRRLVHTALVAVGVITLVFVALRLSGDPAATMLPGDASVDELHALFQEVIIYGIGKRVSFKPRPDYRLLAAEMTVTR